MALPVYPSDLQVRRADDVMRKCRRRLATNAERYSDRIRLDPVRGWLIEPALAAKFFPLLEWPALTLDASPGQRLVEAEPPRS